MFKSGTFIVLLLLSAIVLFSGCSDEATYPITPEIKFKSLEKYISSSAADSLVISFTFTDGDGDLGTPFTDPTTRDIFARLFELKNGVFVEAILAAPLEYRLPYLEPRGNNNSLKGEVRINIDYNILQPNDTIYYKLFIKDRAGHTSNEITSSTIITRIE